MGLQVWLPLIDNIKNQGVSDLNFISEDTNTISSTSIGKIGSASYYNNSKTAGGFISDKKLILKSKNISMFAWVRPESWHTNPMGIGGMHTIWHSTEAGHYGCGSGMSMQFIQHPNGSRVLAVSTGTGTGRTWGDFYSDTALSVGTWYHVGFTYDGTYIKIYINGYLDKTIAYTAQSNPSDYVFIFGWARDGAITNTARIFNADYKLSGYINDFRVYDEALTQKEIREIAKGLVAHYKLSLPGKTNCLMNASKYTKDNPFIRWVSDSSPASDSYIYHPQSDFYFKIDIGGDYTFVMETDGEPVYHNPGHIASSTRGLCWSLHKDGKSWSPSIVGIGQGGEKYFTFKNLPIGIFDIRSNLYSSDGANYRIKCWNIKVVQGLYHSDDMYIPNQNEALYTKLNFAHNYLNDTSGFGNHLTAAGSIRLEDNSIRYDTCIDFYQKGYFKKDNFNMNTQAFTIAFWMNAPYYTSEQHFICGTFNSWLANGFGMWRDKNGSTYSALLRSSAESPYTGLPNHNVSANTWDHIAYTWDGTQCIYYKNGIEISRVTGGQNGTVFHPVLYLGTSLFGDINTETDESWMSDFRFYVTALPAYEIADLAKTATKVDKQGNLLTYELSEKGKSNISKNGKTQAKNLNHKVKSLKEMETLTLPDRTSWARIHSLDLTDSKSFFTNAAEVNKSITQYNRYSRLGLVNDFKANDNTYEYMLTYPSMKKTLPEGYVQLEYIEATGTQYISTGVTGGAKWEFDLQFTDTTTRQLMGYGGEGAEYWGSQENGMYGLATWGYMNVASGNRDTIVHDYESSQKTLWIQNVTYGPGTTNVDSKTYQIFAINGSHLCKAKLWRCRCIQGGTLIRDFIPAMRANDKVIGLYDLVNNVFYTNAGSGDFLCNYTELDYIESSGIQCINTGIAPTTDMEVEISFIPTGGLAENAIFGSSWSASGFFLMLYQNKIRWHSGGTAIDIGSYQVGDIITCRCANNYIIVNGIKHTIAGGTNSTNNIMILDDMGYNSSKKGMGRIKYVKMWSGGTVVRDYIPCKQGNAIGLYDKVNKTFYNNAGQGTFIAGYKPNAYQELEYIKGSGTQYIDTNFQPNQDTRMVVKAYLDSPYSIYGGTPGYFNITGNANGVYFYYDGYDNMGGQGSSTIKNWYNSIHVFEQNKNYCYVDGSLIHTFAYKTFTSPGDLFLFGRNYGDALDDSGTCRIYSCQLYNNDSLIKDFIPCISPTGEVGMYDKLNNIFYGNSGSGNFIPGPTKKSVPLYNRWIQTSAPSATSASGFKSITTSWPQHHAGLRKHGTSCIYNCDSGTSWYAPIGQLAIWEGGIPAADGTMQLQTELWIRTDRIEEASTLKIDTNCITSKNFIEW